MIEQSIVRLIWVALACTLTFGCSEKPAHHDAKDHTQIDGSSLRTLTVGELIDCLVDVSEEGIGFHSTAWVSGFIGNNDDEEPQFEGGVLGSSKPVIASPMRELVQRGLSTLPELLGHVNDPRKTKLVVSGLMWMKRATEYDPRHRGARQSELAPEADIDGGNRGYTVCVGDLCYVAVGQIVNRHLYALRYQPSGGLIINSPIESPQLTAEVQRDWEGLTAIEHRESLIADALNTTPYADWGAWRHRCFYYPDVAEGVAVKLLNRPLYDNGKLWDFLTHVLVKEEDDTKWQELINAYVGEHGIAVAEVLPLWLHWIYHETSFEETPEFLAGRARSDKLLAKLYPDYDRNTSAFLNAADSDEHTSAIKATASYRSEKVDKAVFEVFEAAMKFPFEKEDRQRLDELVSLSLKRLDKSPYGEACRADAARWQGDN